MKPTSTHSPTLRQDRGRDLATRFNRSVFGRWIETSAGRRFRVVAGVLWAGVGLALWASPAGKAALAFSVLPLSAGLLDICWVSAALGGPLRGSACRRLAARPADT
ncbi:hypothetical protein [Nostocoides sp. HKS02]|uniref:hypothetical protein n=1 Tax=Nostocoides sp. HKS02 TaxID=1813880 RepID=UPI0012B4D14D|nr:hypothetical protein [Tetrasphaera sp. HKS02]QGN57612.1 hypothetical protein GKE56_06710 [Tetrasphaera sp. HKS02]